VINCLPQSTAAAAAGVTLADTLRSIEYSSSLGKRNSPIEK